MKGPVSRNSFGRLKAQLSGFVCLPRVLVCRPAIPYHGVMHVPAFIKKYPVRSALGALATVLVILAGGFVTWALMAAPPSGLAMDALASDDAVDVRTGEWLTFSPKTGGTVRSAETSESTARPLTGFIFYPGARVDFRAYAPLVREIAKGGYPSFLVSMPLNLAMFDIHAADRIRAANPGIKRWVIAGHSLGGAMAAQYLADSFSPAGNTSRVTASSLSGLILLGAYSTSDLSAYDSLRVLSVSGSQDGLSTPAKIRANAKNLPGAARFLEIAGGNHAHFGNYGDQDGDLPASIPPLAQRQASVAAILEFLDSLP